jgi:hypothetical protein
MNDNTHKNLNVGKVRFSLKESLNFIDTGIICEICLKMKPFGIQFYVNNGYRWITICKDCTNQIYETVQS